MKRIWKKLAALALAAALLLPAVPAARAEEPAEPSGDLMSFAGAVSGMIQEYGLESEGEVGLLDLELAERFATARLIVKAAGEIDPLNAVSVIDGFRDLHVLQFADPADAAAAFEVYEAMDSVEYVEPDGIVTVAADNGPAPNGKADSEEKAEEAEPEEETETEEPEAEEAPVELLADEDFLSWGFRSYGYEVQTEVSNGGESWTETEIFNGINMTDLQTAVLKQYGNKKANLPSVTVAVLDSGVMDDHEFLSGYVLKDKGYDFINNDNWANADHDHGTHVAGTVLDGTKALGNVKILPVKVLDENGSGSDVQVSLGILYAAEQNVDVINMSLGGEGYSYMMREAVDVAVESGVTVVVSAGNDSMDACDYSPACFDNVICVAATGNWGDLAYYSNYGEVVDVSAPGSEIWSSVPYDKADETADKYQQMNGTSMATPHVAAVAALLLTAEPDLTPVEVELRLEAACLNPVENWGYHPEDAVYPNLLDVSALMGSTAKEIRISRETVSACVGQEFLLTATTTPKKQPVTWKSSDSAVATVEDGKVTCLKEGTATITAAYGGFSAACAITVQALELTMPEDLTLPVDGTTRVHATAEGLDPMPELTWSVADPDIAEIYVFMEDGSDWPVENIPNGATANGVVVHGLKAGTTTVSASFGGVTESFTVNVVNLGSWFDADGDEHYISNLDELDEFSWAVSYGAEDFFTGHTVYLKNNLNMAGKTDYEPISGFNGTFDGQGYTVSNLTFTDAEYGYIGLFSGVDKKGVVRDLTVSVDISCIGEEESCVAGLVAENAGLIENCHVTGTVYAPACFSVGGVTGQNSGTVKNCSNAASVTARCTAAGIAGENSGTISGCSNTADILTVGWSVGGIAGYCGGDVTDCSNSGTVYGENWRIGGIVGYSYSGTVSGCENTGAVSGGAHVGGIVGQTDDLVIDCVNTGAVAEATFYNDYWSFYAFGGIAGYSFLGGIQNCVNTGTVSCDAYYVGGILGYGCGTEIEACRNEAEYVIGTGCTGGIVGCCAEDIQDENSYEWLFPSSVSACGNRADVISIYSDCTGGIIGYGYETAVEYCWNEGDVVNESGKEVGGIAGSLANTEYHLRDCANGGSVSGYNYVGGIIGRAESNTDIEGSAQIYNCVNYGAVSVTSTYNNCCGGLAGSASFSEFRNCLNAGTVSGSGDAGGLVGYFTYGTGLLENCVVQGQVSGENAGLLCGYVVDNYGESEIRLVNCYMEPSGSKYGHKGSAVIESDCSGFYLDGADDTYTLAKSVTADGKTYTDLVDALNAVVMAAHADKNGLDLNRWAEIDVEGSTRLRMLNRVVEITLSSRENDTLVAVLPWKAMDTENNPGTFAARYNGGQMTAVGKVDWSDGYLAKADLSRGNGADLRIFSMDTKTGAPASAFVKVDG